MGAYTQTNGASAPPTGNAYHTLDPSAGAPEAGGPISQGGKGTSTPTAGGPNPVPSAASQDWYSTLMQKLQGGNNMAGFKAPDYAQMTAQALNGNTWAGLTPKAAEQPKAADPAPAAAPTSEMQTQLAALTQQQQERDAQDRANYQFAQMAGHAARGGAMNGSDDDDIVKLALNFLRRYRP